MQHQDTTIVADVGQDGHSGDKSIRLTLPYTQLGIASIPANDGSWPDCLIPLVRMLTPELGTAPTALDTFP